MDLDTSGPKPGFEGWSLGPESDAPKLLKLASVTVFYTSHGAHREN